MISVSTARLSPLLKYSKFSSKTYFYIKHSFVYKNFGFQDCPGFYKSNNILPMMFVVSIHVAMYLVYYTLLIYAVYMNTKQVTKPECTIMKHLKCGKNMCACAKRNAQEQYMLTTHMLLYKP